MAKSRFLEGILYLARQPVPSASQEKILLCSPMTSEDLESWEQFVIPDFWNLTERFVWSENKGRLSAEFDSDNRKKQAEMRPVPGN